MILIYVFGQTGNKFAAHQVEVFLPEPGTGRYTGITDITREFSVEMEEGKEPVDCGPHEIQWCSLTNVDFDRTGGSSGGKAGISPETIARGGAWACIAAIAILSLVPGTERPHTFLPGRAEHFMAYAGTGFFLALGYLGSRQRLFAWISLAGASGAFELMQNLVPGRSPSLFDALASTSGLTLGMGLGAVVAAALARYQFNRT